MTKKYISPFFYLIFAVLLTLGLSLSLQSLMAAWNPPTSAPPADNVPAPLNVGANDQEKDGGLGLGINPSHKLDVNGDIRTSNDLYMSDSKSIRIDDAGQDTNLLIGNYGDGGGFQYGVNFEANLAVEGSIKANQLCFGDADCKDSWTSVGGTSGWTDDGDIVRLTTAANRVSIGAADGLGNHKLYVGAVNGDLVYIGRHNGEIGDYSNGVWLQGPDNGTGGFLTFPLAYNTAGLLPSGGTMMRHGSTNLGEILSSGDLIFSTGATFMNEAQGTHERMRITAAGDVGIGTNAPGAKLEVESSLVNTDDQNMLSDLNLSGNLTANRTNRGLYIDVDSSAIGTQADGQRHYIRGLESRVNINGTALPYSVLGTFSQATHNGTNATPISNVYGSYNYALNNSTGAVVNLMGAHNIAINNTTGSVTGGLRGTYSYARNDNGAVANAYGGQFFVFNNAAGGTIANARGVTARIYENAGSITNGYAVYADCNDATTCFGLYVVTGDNEVTNDYGIYISGDASTDYGIYATGEQKNYFSGSVTAASFIYSSDESLKNNILPIENALDKVMELEGVTFEWGENGELNIGVVAQNVEKVFPEAVVTDEETGLKSVKYGNLIAPLIEAIKEQQAQIEELREEIKVIKDGEGGIDWCTE